MLVPVSPQGDAFEGFLQLQVSGATGDTQACAQCGGRRTVDGCHSRPSAHARWDRTMHEVNGWGYMRKRTTSTVTTWLLPLPTQGDCGGGTAAAWQHVWVRVAGMGAMGVGRGLLSQALPLVLYREPGCLRHLVS